ncbi:hypothetical protein AMTR_s00046p00194450 [Amborella trichopoda]|uniref:Uncharacterized protein n=1 Tax=Amborella trichopoda TaxID=13333 RepID=U5DCC7_AMBTC|nr:hypothetical protein AMTR_s00046p00194450 [Amborella trichopoda]
MRFSFNGARPSKERSIGLSLNALDLPDVISLDSDPRPHSFISSPRKATVGNFLRWVVDRLTIMEGNYASDAIPPLDSARDCPAILEGEYPSLDGAPSLDGEEANSDVEVAVNGPIITLVPPPPAMVVLLAVVAPEFLDNLAQVYDVNLPVVTAEPLIEPRNFQSENHVMYLGMLGDMGASFQAPIQQVLSVMDVIAQAAIANNVVSPSMADTSMEDWNASSFPPVLALTLASMSPIIGLDVSDVIPSLETQATAKAKDEHNST